MPIETGKLPIARYTHFNHNPYKLRHLQKLHIQVGLRPDSLLLLLQLGFQSFPALKELRVSWSTEATIKELLGESRETSHAGQMRWISLQFIQWVNGELGMNAKLCHVDSSWDGSMVGDSIWPAIHENKNAVRSPLPPTAKHMIEFEIEAFSQEVQQSLHGTVGGTDGATNPIGAQT